MAKSRYNLEEVQDEAPAPVQPTRTRIVRKSGGSNGTTTEEIPENA